MNWCAFLFSCLWYKQAFINLGDLKICSYAWLTTWLFSQSTYACFLFESTVFMHLHQKHTYIYVINIMMWWRRIVKVDAGLYFGYFCIFGQWCVKMTLTLCASMLVCFHSNSRRYRVVCVYIGCDRSVIGMLITCIHTSSIKMEGLLYCQTLSFKQN